MREIPKQALMLVALFEGCELEAYPDPATGKDPWTIGFGHTGPEVKPGLIITKEQAQQWLKEDMEHSAYSICRLLPKTKLSDNQFSALCSLVFNIGVGNFRSSSVFKHLSMGRYKQASDSILLWDKAKNSKGEKVALAGLTRRRKAEKELFDKE